MPKRSLAALIEHHEAKAQYWYRRAKEFEAKAQAANDKAVRMRREAKEAAGGD